MEAKLAIMSVILWLSVSSGSPDMSKAMESRGACDYSDLRPSPEGCNFFLQCANGDEFNMPCQVVDSIDLCIESATEFSTDLYSA